MEIPTNKPILERSTEYAVPDSQFIVKIDDERKVLVTLICDDENEQMKFLITSNDNITDEEIESVRLTLEKMILDFMEKMEEKEKQN